ncbi:11860_t:CDS:2 [Racocetra persica]|uniref:11860_t:CDS:1 n=1 Tax=Racocetra persica TaxID=160502 RepID=A0ACA9LJJ5_9GLOM|nr:11860_t:CDS:2 [Racocetra persica]
MAKVINARKADNVFENTFVTQHKSTYATKDHLALLTKKAEVFLFKIFENTYQKLGQSSIKNTKYDKFTFQLASLNFVVNKKQMLLGFSSDYFPSSNTYPTNSNLVESLKADETNNLEGQILNENDILEKLEKNKDVLPPVEQAYVIAHERFLNL